MFSRHSFNCNLSHQTNAPTLVIFPRKPTNTIFICLPSEFPLLDSQAIRVAPGDGGGVNISLCAPMDTTRNSEGQIKGTTLTPDQWLHLTKRADDIEAAVLRLAS